MRQVSRSRFWSTLNAVSSVTDALKREIEAEGAAFSLNKWKSQAPEIVAPAMSIVITNAEGRVAAATIGHDSSPVYLAERDYFIAQRNNPNLGLYIGQPVFGKLSKRMIIPVTRRLETKDGKFAGVVSFSLASEFLTALHQKVRLGKDTSINLVRTDGVRLARYTTSKGFDASDLAASRKVEAIEGAKTESGKYSAQSPVDGVFRIYHWRKVAGYPLIVVVGLGRIEALAAANLQARIVIGLGIAALSLPLIMMLILNREIQPGSPMR